MKNKELEKFILNNLKKINSKYRKFKTNINFFDQGLDSLDFFNLLFKIENKYNCKIKTKDFIKVQTVDKMVKYIKKNKV